MGRSRMRGVITCVIACGVMTAGPGALGSAVASALPGGSDGNSGNNSDNNSNPRQRVAAAIAGRIAAAGASPPTGSFGTRVREPGFVTRPARLPPVPTAPSTRSIVIRAERPPFVPATPATPALVPPVVPSPVVTVSRTQPTQAGSAPITMNVPGVGEVALDGAIAGKYRQMGGEGVLGLPTGQPRNVGDGTAQAFAKGTIFSSPSTGPHVVWGEILNRYLAQGGPTSPLGFPTTDEFEICAGGPNVAHGGWGSEFEHGYIWWLNWGDVKHTFQGYTTMKGDGSRGCDCGSRP